jgi:predicted RNase H-like nuclease (RuvC/YqgF family)
MLDEVTFTGAAILLRSKAAYVSTWIELDAEDLTNKKWRGPAMNQEQHNEQNRELVNVTQRMASAAEALSESIARLNAQHEDLSAKVERIVAAVDNEDSEMVTLRAKVAELESANSELREKLQAGAAVSTRKTLPPIVTALLAKSGVEVGDTMDAAALDAAMSPLSIEQRIAVKAQLARAGLIG